MKYFVLIAYSPDVWNAATSQQQQAWHQDHVRFHREVGEHLLGGEALDGASTATTLRREQGRSLLTDGPFAETTEMIGGFYLIEATDLDQAVQWCELLPDCYALEIRPCIDIEVSA
ncbi:YciI family protein [Calidifontibacter terrae]